MVDRLPAPVLTLPSPIHNEGTKDREIRTPHPASAPAEEFFKKSICRDGFFAEICTESHSTQECGSWLGRDLLITLSDRAFQEPFRELELAPTVPGLRGLVSDSPVESDARGALKLACISHM